MPKKSLKNWWDLLNHNIFTFRKNQTPYFHPFFAYSEQLSPNSIIALLESPPQAVIAKPLCMMGRTPQTHHHSHKSMDNPFMKIGCPEGGERGGGWWPHRPPLQPSRLCRDRVGIHPSRHCQHTAKGGPGGPLPPLPGKPFARLGSLHVLVRFRKASPERFLVYEMALLRMIYTLKRTPEAHI